VWIPVRRSLKLIGVPYSQDAPALATAPVDSLITEASMSRTEAPVSDDVTAPASQQKKKKAKKSKTTYDPESILPTESTLLSALPATPIDESSATTALEPTKKKKDKKTKKANSDSAPPVPDASADIVISGETPDLDDIKESAVKDEEKKKKRKKESKEGTIAVAVDAGSLEEAPKKKKRKHKAEV
jgi:hypothetical protein